MMSSFEYTKRNKDTRFEFDKNRKICKVDAKRRFTFMDITEADPLLSKLMSRTGGNVRADLRSGASHAKMVDLRGASPINIEWRLQYSLTITVEGEMMAKLTQI